MSKIGLFYASVLGETLEIAKLIQKEIGEDRVDIISVENVWLEDFKKYDFFILGVPTWYDGELAPYWSELLPILNKVDFKNKTVAIYGTADQQKYPDSFADGVGIIDNIVKNQGATIIGKTSSENYNFISSKALDEYGKTFKGLILDNKNQKELTQERIKKWVKELNL